MSAETPDASIPDASIPRAAALAGGLRIRPAGSGDLESLSRLLAELDRLHAELHPDFFRAAPRERAALTRLLTDQRVLVLLAEGAEGELLGSISARLYDTPPQPMMRRRLRAYLDDLYVEKRARRRGIARALMLAARRWARSRGAEQLVLTVWSGNDAAEQLYAQLGYAGVNRVLALGCDAEESSPEASSREASSREASSREASSREASSREFGGQ